MSELSEPKKPQVPLDKIKSCLEICSKLFVWGALIIFGIFCIEIGRIPDIELSALGLLLGISFAMAAILVVGIASVALLPGLCLSSLTKFRSAPRPIGTPLFLLLCQLASCGLLFFVPAELIPVLWLAILTFCTVGLAWSPLVSLRLSEEPQEENRRTWSAFFSTNLSTLGAALICSFAAMTYAALLLLVPTSDYRTARSQRTRRQAWESLE
jgi:hypothetical protein